MYARSHYTGHFKSVITKHQNVFVMKDIMANGYRAGGNTKFFGKTLGEIREGLMTRLNMDDTTGDAVLPSMLAFPMTVGQYDSGNMDIAMSVTSRYLPYEVASQSHKSFPGGQGMFDLYDQNIGLRAVHFGEDMRASENMEYMSQGSTNNSLCFLGPHRRYDSINKTYTQLIPGMGHWGPDARPGDVSFRRILELVLLTWFVFSADPLTLLRSALLFAGALAPRRGGQHDLRPRGHDDLRAVELHPQAQGLSAAPPLTSRTRGAVRSKS